MPCFPTPSNANAHATTEVFRFSDVSLRQLHSASVIVVVGSLHLPLALQLLCLPIERDLVKEGGLGKWGYSCSLLCFLLLSFCSCHQTHILLILDRRQIRPSRPNGVWKQNLFTWVYGFFRVFEVVFTKYCMFLLEAIEKPEFLLLSWPTDRGLYASPTPSTTRSTGLHGPADILAHLPALPEELGELNHETQATARFEKFLGLAFK